MKDLRGKGRRERERERERERRAVLPVFVGVESVEDVFGSVADMEELLAREGVDPAEGPAVVLLCRRSRKKKKKKKRVEQ
jgi:hypothetical protein